MADQINFWLAILSEQILFLILYTGKCSWNPCVGLFVGACFIGFFSNLYYQGTNVAAYIVFAIV